METVILGSNFGAILSDSVNYFVHTFLSFFHFFLCGLVSTDKDLSSICLFLTTPFYLKKKAVVIMVRVGWNNYRVCRKSSPVI